LEIPDRLHLYSFQARSTNSRFRTPRALAVSPPRCPLFRVGSRQNLLGREIAHRVHLSLEVPDRIAVCSVDLIG
jgi:hypothetical protein